MHTQLRLRGHTLGLRGEHGLGQDAADDTCEGHAEDEEGRGGILGLAEGLLVDVAEDGEGECAPYDDGLLDEHAGGGGGHGCLAVPVAVLGPLGGEREVVREQLRALCGGLVQHGGGSH